MCRERISRRSRSRTSLFNKGVALVDDEQRNGCQLGEEDIASSVERRVGEFFEQRVGFAIGGPATLALFRVRAVRVFWDTSSLAANPALWPAIEQALAASEYFILMASPETAASARMKREKTDLRRRSIHPVIESYLQIRRE
jgi:hypothetical protein